MSQADGAVDDGLVAFDWAALEAKREQAGYSLDSLSSALRITKDSIIAIESGAVDKLPSPVFAKGYIRQYAAALNLDANEMLNAYADAMSLAQPTKRKEEFYRPNKKTPKLDPKRHHDATPSSESGGVGKVVAVVLFLVALGGAGAYAAKNGLLDELLAGLSSQPESESSLALPLANEAEAQPEANQLVLPDIEDSAPLSDESLPPELAEAFVEEEPAPEPQQEAALVETPLSDDEPAVSESNESSEPDVIEEVAALVNDVQQSDSSPLTVTDSPAVELEAESEVFVTSETLGVDLAEAEPEQEVVVDASLPAADAVESQRLVIGFTEDCWVEVRDSAGKLLVASIRNADRGVDVSSASLPINVTLGALSAVAFVEFNGELVELSDSGRGNVARLTLGEPN